MELLFWFLAILSLPFVVYLTVKLGTYAFLQARSNFKQDQENQ
jgi:hypothetical protein